MYVVWGLAVMTSTLCRKIETNVSLIQEGDDASDSAYDLLFKVPSVCFPQLRSCLRLLPQIVLIGDSGVGKSNLLMRFLDGK